MLPVSREYQEAIKADVREFRARVEVSWTDPYIDQTIVITTSEQARISWPKQTADAKEAPTYKYAALDGAWRLDGTWHLAPDDEEQARFMQMGWWSRQLAGADGYFSEPYPNLTVRFRPRPVFGLKVVGDAKREEWPVDFDILIYDKTNTLVHTEVVTNNQDIYWQRSIEETNLLDVSWMRLYIKRWSHPSRHAKIVEFFTSVSEIYDSNEIIFLSLLEEREVSAGSLPIGNISANEIDVRLVNVNDRFTEGNIHSLYHNLMKPNRKIRVWVGPVLPSGLVEYQPLGVYWSRDWHVPEQEYYAETTARDRMHLLEEGTKQYNCPLVQNANLYERVIHILQDAGLSPDEYWVDPELKEHTVEWFWMEPCSHREALRKVVERCLGQAYADRKGVIRVEGPSFIRMPEEEE